MATFFSGTDISTLNEEGASTAHFVSLIVNNSGPYCAKITRKVTATIKGTKEISYNTFNNEVIKTTIELNEELVSTIESFNLNIEIEGYKDFSDVEARYKEIIESKKKIVSAPVYQSTFRYPNEKEEFTPQYLGSNVSNFSSNKPVKPNNSNSNLKSIVDSLTAQILYGAVTMNQASFDKCDKKKWLESSMEKCFERRFGKGKEGLARYESWVTNFIDVVLSDVDTSDIYYAGYTRFDYISDIAMGIIDNIEDMIVDYKLTKNVYITKILEILPDYLNLEEAEEIKKDTPIQGVIFKTN